MWNLHEPLQELFSPPTVLLGLTPHKTSQGKRTNIPKVPVCHCATFLLHLRREMVRPGHSCGSSNFSLTSDLRNKQIKAGQNAAAALCWCQMAFTQKGQILADAARKTHLIRTWQVLVGEYCNDFTEDTIYC